MAFLGIMASVKAEPGCLFCFGLGYTALALALRLQKQGWRIIGTCRSPEKQQQLRLQAIECWIFPSEEFRQQASKILAPVTHILVSIPPSPTVAPIKDSVLTYCQGLELPRLRWLAYLSTTGVYGDHGGNWVDENTITRPRSLRQHRRLQAEQSWLSLQLAHPIPIYIFRLAGIYGPARSAIDRVRSGQARRIDKPGHFFNRIHITDLVNTLQASMRTSPDTGEPGCIYNLADDHPAPAHEVTSYACQLLGIKPPPLIPQADLPESLADFFSDNRRVANHRIKQELKIQLEYPSYHGGLLACLE